MATPGLRTGSFLVAAALAVAIHSAAAQRGASPTDLKDMATARTEIAAEYVKWGNARLTYDRAVFDRMLLKDFYVQTAPDAPKSNRDEFINMISQASPTAILKRFDSQILTVQHQADGLWVVVITEKLEGDRTTPDGSHIHASSLWVTRDGWRKEGTQWRIAFSEGVGSEWWPGVHPPFMDWESKAP